MNNVLTITGRELRTYLVSPLAWVIIALFAQYLALSMEPGSVAQKPEKLFRERTLIGFVALLAALFLFATYINIPALDALTGQRYISVQ